MLQEFTSEREEEYEEVEDRSLYSNLLLIVLVTVCTLLSLISAFTCFLISCKRKGKDKDSDLESKKIKEALGSDQQIYLDNFQLHV